MGRNPLIPSCILLHFFPVRYRYIILCYYYSFGQHYNANGEVKQTSTSPLYDSLKKKYFPRIVIALLHVSLIDVLCKAEQTGIGLSYSPLIYSGIVSKRRFHSSLERHGTCVSCCSGLTLAACGWDWML